MMNLFRPRLEIVVVLVTTFLLSTMVTDANSFEFIIEPSHTSAVQGTTVTLYCSVNQDTRTFMWVRDTSIISHTIQIQGNADPDRYSVSYSSKSYNLIIENLKPEDAGTYQCVAFSSGGGITSDGANLDVISPPSQEYPLISSSVTGTIVVGETIEIVCEIEGGNPVPEIELVRGNEVIVVASGRLVYVWVTEEVDDGAVFECRARHSLWTEPRSSYSSPFQILTESPNIVLAPSTAEVTLGSTVSFVCAAAPATRAVYRWFLNNEELGSNVGRSVVIESTETASVLRLVGSREVNGLVRCQVEAANGQASAEAALTLIITEVSTQAPPTPAASTERDTQAPTLPTEATTHPPRATDTPSGPTIVPEETDTPSGPTIVPEETDTPSGPTIVPEQPASSTEGITSLTTEDLTSDSAEPPIRGASSFDTIFVASVSAIAALIGVIFIAAIGAVCYVTAKRRRKRRADMYSGANNDGDVFFRSRYISIVRSWFSPVHQDTQKTLTSFEGPTPDQSPYNTVASRR
ncbi:cell adhesion molecule 2-like [Lytechinus variegatus]|uniref:cell adhesion molecule 2-like n=1 Tax=Lytechinus variegatus TaxID=7654 RepID=UPI001BB1F706|nr:cell adhesion molecule 2-like [Lytechinus variegatus]